jgi:hypothetical protein
LPLFELVFYCIGMAVMTDPDYGEVDLAAELDARAAAGALLPPMDVEARDLSDGPMEISEMDFYDTASHRLSEVDALEWELFAAIDHDEAERFLLEDKAPPWMTLPPGGELATALERLRPTVESPIALVEVMKASGRLVAWAESIKIAAMASFYRQREAQAADIPRPVTDERGRPADPLRSAAAEIGAALRLAPSTTDSHISNALRLTSVLPMTYGALRCGAISLSKALTIAEATAHLPLEAQHDVEEKVLPRAPEQTQGALKAALRRAVARVDARREGKRHKDAVKERQCRLVPLADGMAGLWLTHTADKIRTLFAAIQALAAAAETPPADESDSPVRRWTTQVKDLTTGQSASRTMAGRMAVMPSTGHHRSQTPRQIPNEIRIQVRRRVRVRRRSQVRRRTAIGGPLSSVVPMSTCSRAFWRTGSIGSDGSCPTSTGDDLTSRSWFRSPLCSAWTTTRASSPGTGPSRPRWRVPSPPMALGDAS